jgi:stage II sporulation protein D
MPTDTHPPHSFQGRHRVPQRSKGKGTLHRALRASASLLALLAAISPSQAQPPEPSSVRINVLSLFHPRTLILTATQPLTLTLDTQTLNLPPNQPTTLTADDTTIRAGEIIGQSLTLTPATFTLTVPGKLTRLYRGALTLTSVRGELIPVIAMPTELAVASIVQAESPPRASVEALKAQAVVSRSFLLARPAPHFGFDACDTTHCQFLRSPPAANSPAALATRATRNLVLTWRPTPEAPPRIVRAMYARSCGGHTRPHPTTPDEYPFYAVRCDFCLRHPERWRRTLAPSQTPRTEQQRLAWNRTHGWESIPSNTHTSAAAALEGRGTGHGIGLCQLGASDLAARGENYQKILAHYFPNTTLSELK